MVAIAGQMPCPVAAGPAINQFEVKDLQSSPGDLEFQSQNAYSTGQPRRRIAETSPGEFTYDDNTVTRQRESLEIQLGVTDWFRVRLGIEYEQPRTNDPAALAEANTFESLKLSEVAVEGVIVFVKPKPEGVGIGLLLEYGSPIGSHGSELNELFIGPIIEAHTGPWSAIGNFAIVDYIGSKFAPYGSGVNRDKKLDFSYFVQGEYRFSDSFALALEAYGTIDRLGDSGTRSQDALIFGDFNQHRIGPVAYYTVFPNGRASRSSKQGRHRGAQALGAESDDDAKELSVTIGAGALFGLNDDTPDQTYKLSIEVDY